MTDTNTICCSPTNKGTRCSNICNNLDSKSLCKVHAKKARPLYLRYKKYQKNNQRYITIANYDDLQIPLLLKIYHRLHQLYTLRLDHHKQYYMPSLIDEGHKFYLERLLYKMLECERALMVKFQSSGEQSNNLISYEEEEVDISTPGALSDQVERVKSKNKQVIDDSSVWLDTIPRLIAENQAEYTKRKTLLNLIYDRLKNTIEGRIGAMTDRICFIVIWIYLYCLHKDIVRRADQNKNINTHHSLFNKILMKNKFDVSDIVDGELKFIYHEKHAKDLLLNMINQVPGSSSQVPEDDSFVALSLEIDDGGLYEQKISGEEDKGTRLGFFTKIIDLNNHKCVHIIFAFDHVKTPIKVNRTIRLL